MGRGVRVGGTLGDISQTDRAEGDHLPAGAPSRKVAENYQRVEEVLRLNPGMKQPEACAKAGVALSTYQYAKRKMEEASGFSGRDLIRPGDAIVKAEQRRASDDEARQSIVAQMFDRTVEAVREQGCSDGAEPHWVDPTPAETEDDAGDVATEATPAEALANCITWIELLEPRHRRRVARALAAYFEDADGPEAAA